MGRLGIDQDALETFLQAVRTRFPLVRAILFGSRARGNELLESDYDLILVSPAFAPIPFPTRAAAINDLWHLDAPLEVLCYTPEEFQRKAQEISVVAEAEREGMELIA
ncbi:MAG: nucleotidyltransferase domain-containing protein [Deinococcus sp.]|nr:nucleotidyltransferase domain-containing protein [Deinococcus sp.]